MIAGRYRLGSRLGRGGMAEVLDAFDERLERPVALKVLRPEVAADAGMRRRFEAEARAAARFSHPAVVSVYDSGEHAGRAFLVMERLPGETLADRIAAGPVDQVWLRSVALDVLAALQAAHDIGLLHRDIKPGNVLITTEDRVKVADFGIAKMMIDQGGADGDQTAVGLVLGTPAYLAPERLAGQPATVSTDLFALGVVLYEAATGHKPQAGALDATVAGTGAAGAAGDAVVGIDPDLARVIGRAMAPRPEDRYPSAEAMAADLRRDGRVEVAPTIVAAPAVVADAGTRLLPIADPVVEEGLVEEPADHRRALGIAAAALLVIIALVIILILAANTKSSNGPSTTTTVPATTTTAPPPTTTTIPAITPTTARQTTTSRPAATTTTVPRTTTTKATTTTAPTSTTTPTTTTPTIPPTTLPVGAPPPGRGGQGGKH